jgi:phage tail sheath protein FI
LSAEDCDLINFSILKHCGKMKNCMGLLEIHGGDNLETMESDITRFRTNMGTANLKYGAVYYPLMKKGSKTIPTSGIMAGLISRTDNKEGVWKAPANISLNPDLKPAFDISNELQENLNVDAVSGKSINAIRTFPNQGTLVWGARTLDGNSLDWRYINVVRTISMIEESINNYLEKNVFEPNDANTWSRIEATTQSFLNGLWRDGALAGSTPNDAYSVNIGLGSTMTAVDILENRLRLDVKVAVARPAEFIVLTFEHEMQKK